MTEELPTTELGPESFVRELAHALNGRFEEAEREIERIKTSIDDLKRSLAEINMKLDNRGKQTFYRDVISEVKK